VTTVTESVRTPYKGLSPFDDSELDALLFFGRERETEIVTANALASRLTVLYGPSGVGKSSLLRAGVLRSTRKLAESEPLAVAYFSSWSVDPVAAIEEAVRGALAEALGGDPGDAPGDLVDRFDAWTAALGGELCLVLDQFEELFLYHEEGELLEVLPELVTRPGLRVNVVLGIRDDELAKLDIFKARIPILFSNYLRLDLLERNGARAAILGPLERYNELEGRDVTIEPALVEVVLEEVAAGRIDPARAVRGGVAAETVEDHSRVETPYLQLVMQKLWEVERERHSDVLRLATLAELGGAQRVVEDHLQHAMDALTPSQRDVAAGMFDHLVTPSGAKIAHGAADLASFAHVAEADVQPVLSSLARERILRPTGENGQAGNRYEIYHDVLAGAVLAWRAQHEAQAALERERAESRRRQHRLAILVGVVLAAFAVMSALAAYALSQRGTARHATSIALAQRKVAVDALHREQLQKKQVKGLNGRLTHSLRTQEQLSSAVARQNKDLEDKNAQLAAKQEQLQQQNEQLAANKTQLQQQNEQLAANKTQLQQQNEELQAQTRIATDQQHKAEHETQVAKQQTHAANEATFAAVQQRSEAIKQRNRADAQTIKAKRATHAAKVERDKALAAEQTTKADELLARALAELRTDPQQSVKDAFDSTDFRSLPQTEPVLRSSLQAMNMLAELPARGAVSQTAYSRDGRRIAVADRAGDVRIFDVASTKRLASIPTAAPLNGIAWAPDGRTIATAGSDGETRVWSLDAPQSPTHVLDQGGPVRSVAFSPDGRLVLSAGGNDARLWDAASGVKLHTLPLPRPARAATFSRDGSLILTVENSPTARVWNAVDGMPVTTLTQRAEITSAAFSPDGKLIVTGSRDATGRTWDSSTGVPQATLEGHSGQIVAVAFSPAGNRVATGSVDGQARVWNLAGIPVGIIDGATSSIVSVAFSPDGQSVVAASSDGNAITWGHGQIKQFLVGQHGPLRMAVYSPDGATVATAGADSVRLWEPYGEGRFRGIHAFKGVATAITFDPSGRYLASGGADGTVVVERAGGRPVRTITIGSPVVALKWAQDDDLLVASRDGNARLYRNGAGSPAVTIAHGSQLVGAALRDDGKVVATAGTDGVVRLWTAAGRLVRPLPAVATLGAVALDPKGGLLAAASGKLVIVYDARTGHELVSLPGHSDTVTGLAFSPDGKQVASSSRDHDARVWDLTAVRSGTIHDKVLHGHTAFVSGVAYSADGRWLATAGPLKAGIWAPGETDLPKSFLQYVRGNQAPITSVAFSPRGWRLAAAGRDGSVRVFDCRLCGRLPQLKSYARARLAALQR
jgi:WD40 repeat protein